MREYAKRETEEKKGETRKEREGKKKKDREGTKTLNFAKRKR